MAIIMNGPNKEKILGFLHQADACLEARQNEQAIIYYKAALSLDPGIGEASYRMAYAYSRLGQNDKAIDILKKNTKKYKTAKSFNLLGQCLSLAGDFDNANKAYRRAQKLDRKNIETIMGLADVIAQKGNCAEAYKLLAPHIINKRLSIDLAHAATNISKKLNQYDDVLEYLLFSEKEEKYSADVFQAQFKYMIGSIYDKKKMHKDAMRYFREANALMPYVYDFSFHDQLADTIKSMYSTDFLAQCNTAVNTSNKPIFIVGMPRSGTTLIEQILSSHSKVHGAGELSYISSYVVKIEEKRMQKYPYCMNGLTSDDLDYFSKSYLDAVSEQSKGSAHVVDKMPHNFVYVGFIKQLFPDSKIIYCKRNPIDTCLSIYFTRFNDSHPYATSFKDVAHQYKYSTEIMKHWTDIYPSSIIEINYEDTVADLETSVEKIISFCGLDMEQGCLEFYENKRFVATASKEQVNKPIYTSSMERWKNYLPDVQPLVDEIKKAGLL